MFEFIRGTLCKKGTEHCVVDVNGVGFRIYTDARTASALGEPGDVVTVYTYLQVKEDNLSLFGFSGQEDLAVFNLLISVNGVGPKMALSILSALNASAISVAVATGDYKTLTAGKGVGTKLAQRIVLELRDKIKTSFDSAEENPAESAVAKDAEDLLQEAAAALVVLGYRTKEANRAVKDVYREDIPLEELVKLALRKLM